MRRSRSRGPYVMRRDGRSAYTAPMRVTSGAHSWDAVPSTCVLCGTRATSTMVPSVGSLFNSDTGKTVHVTTIRLCEPCRTEVVSERAAVGWSWRAERWGRVGTKSPEGDTYLQHGA